MILVDEDQLNQVLINLIINAMEAFEQAHNPKLEISVKRILDSINIEVKDIGPAFILALPVE